MREAMRNLLTATAAVAVILACGPAVAQDSVSARLEALQAEISKLQNEVATLKGDVAEGREEARGAAEQVVAARTATPADAPSVRVSSSNRPTICSPDGRNCISLTSRLQLDFGGYNYRPNTIADAARPASICRLGCDWPATLRRSRSGPGSACGCRRSGRCLRRSGR